MDWLTIPLMKIHNQFFSIPVMLLLAVGLLVWRFTVYRRAGLGVLSILLKQSVLFVGVWGLFQAIHQLIRHNAFNFFQCFKNLYICRTEQGIMFLFALVLAYVASSPAELTTSTESPGATST